MALVLADRVRETTTTAGTGTITLLGAVPSCQSFAVVGNGNTTYYTIVAYTGTEYEVGIGTYTSSGTTLSRDTVLASSNGGSLVNFSAGTKDVFVDYPAGRAVYEDAAGNVDGYPITGGTINNTVIGGTTSAAGTFTTLTATGQTSLGGAAGSESLRILTPPSTGRYFIARGSSGNPDLGVSGGAMILYGGANQGIAFYSNGYSQAQFNVPHTASAVNFAQATGAATGSGPVFSVAGSDTNIDLNLTTKGTGSHVLNTGGGTQFKVLDLTSATTSINARGGVNGGNAQFGLVGTGNTDFIQYTLGTGAFRFLTNGIGVDQFRIAHTASAVNYVQVTGGTTGSVNGTTISSQGSDADVNLRVVPKGAGYFYVRQDSTASTGILLQNRSSTGSPEMGIRFISGGFDLSDSRYAEISSTGGSANTLIFKTGNGSSPQEFQRIAANGDITLGGSNTAPNFKIVRNGSAINFLQVTGAATGFGPLLSAQGTDTNIPLVLQPKGTGALQAQQTDSTATGGNARGARAVDWQMNRDIAARVASGSFSIVAGGSANSATTTYTAALSGLGNTSSGVANVVAGGIVNVGSGVFSAIVGGGYNTSGGWYNFIGGGSTNSGTANAAVTTQSGTMNGTTAVTLSGSNASIKIGQVITGTSIADDTYVAAISGTSLTLSKVAVGSSTSTLSFFTPHGVVVGGGNNQATGSYSFIGGGGDAGTAANRNVASGGWSTVGGGFKNTASGIGSFIGGGGTYDGTSAGGGNTSSGLASFVGGGWSNNSTGAGTVCLGIGGIANGDYSSTLGGTYGTARSIAGNTVFNASNTPLGTAYTNQAALLILARQTTDATATVLRSDGNAASTVNQVVMPNNSAYFFTGEVVAGVTGGGNTKGWTIEGVIKRGANAASTTLVGSTVTSLYADAGAATWAIALSADTTNGGLAVTFTGQASTTIRTVAQIRTTEMTY
jgi:hypothetical protein